MKTFREWVVAEGLMIDDSKADKSKFKIGPMTAAQNNKGCAGGPGPCPQDTGTGTGMAAPAKCKKK